MFDRGSPKQLELEKPQVSCQSAPPSANISGSMAPQFSPKVPSFHLAGPRSFRRTSWADLVLHRVYMHAPAGHLIPGTGNRHSLPWWN